MERKNVAADFEPKGTALQDNNPQKEGDIFILRQMFEKYPAQIAIILTFTALLAVAVALMFAGGLKPAEKTPDYGVNTENYTEQDDSQNIISVSETDTQTEAIVQPDYSQINTAGAASGDIGGIHVEIKGFDLTEDARGKTAVKVYFEYTNNGGGPMAVYYFVTASAAQNGATLGAAFDATGSSGNEKPDQVLMPGETAAVYRLFLLNTETDPVTVTVTDSSAAPESAVTATFALQ